MNFDKIYEALFLDLEEDEDNEELATYVDDTGAAVEMDFNDDEDEPIDDEIELDEKILKRKVIRKGKPYTRYRTTKKGYKVVVKGGKAKEVRLKPAERRRRRRASRKTQRRLKGKRKQMSRKRKKSLRKRRTLGSTRERPGR